MPINSIVTKEKVVTRAKVGFVSRLSESFLTTQSNPEGEHVHQPKFQRSQKYLSSAIYCLLLSLCSNSRVENLYWIAFLVALAVYFEKN